MLNVAYVTDDGYAWICGISILSFIRNNPELETQFYILDAGISGENKKKLVSIAPSVRFIDIRDFEKKEGALFETAGFSPIVMARLFFTEYLPATVDTVLYLDCDTIVAGDVRFFTHEELLAPYEAGMVPELYMPPEKKKESIGLAKEETYYNDGVLWINLKRWRQEKITQRFLDFCRGRHGKLSYPDQDIINHCCRGRILTLPQYFNANPNLPYFPRRFMKKIQPAYRYEPASLYRAKLLRPDIIHYAGDERPWIHGSRNIYRSYFRRYQAMSPWGDHEPVRGRELYMACYHALNMGTQICPHGRILFSRLIGIHVYDWFGGKKN